MFSGVSRQTGKARDRRREHRAHHLVGRIGAVERHHLGAMKHDVGDFELAQVEHAADHVAVELLDAALAVEEVDRAAQLVVAGQDAWFSPTRMPNGRSSHLTNASIAISTGPKIRTTQSIGRATASAIRSGALIAAVFGSTSQNTTIRKVITTVA